MRYVFTFEFLLFAAAMVGFALVGAHITGNNEFVDDMWAWLSKS